MDPRAAGTMGAEADPGAETGAAAGAAPSGARPDAITLRLAADTDLPTCAEIQHIALDDYLRPLGHSVALSASGLTAMAGHILSTDPGRFVVAERDGVPVGFASAWVRGGLWFLALLFVLPAEQGRGLGRRLLEAVLPRPDGRAPSGESYILAVATDSLQPISNALYARYGMVPRMPAFMLGGPASRPEAFPPLPAGAVVIPFAPSGMSTSHSTDETLEIVTPVEAAHLWDHPGSTIPPDSRAVGDVTTIIDREVLGFARPEDHRWLGRERHGVLVTDADGEPLGYGYLRGDGRIGPVAAIDPALVPAIVGALATGAPAALVELSIIVPGAAGDVMRACLDAGLRIADPPTILCWDRPFADFSRYVPTSLAMP